jgi:GDP-D-mannose dehydratase
VLGNPHAEREWRLVEDYLEAMWLGLKQDELDDYVVATGGANTMRKLGESVPPAPSSIGGSKFESIQPSSDLPTWIDRR